MSPSWRRRVLVGAAFVIVVCAYASLRVTMNHEYEKATWTQLLFLRAPLPFGHRVLMPLFASPFTLWSDASPRTIMLGIELVSCAALLIGLYRLARRDHAPNLALALVGGFVLLTPWLFLLPHRWPLYYPYDTAAMALTAFGLHYVIERRVIASVVVMGLGALNRETILILPCAAAALWFGRENLRRLAVWCAALLVTYWMMRQVVANALPQNLGEPIHWMFRDRLRLDNNLRWLGNDAHWATVFAGLAFLPLAWIALWRHVPPFVQRLRFVVLAFGALLVSVGNIYEPRIFGELLVVTWLVLAYGTGAALLSQRYAFTVLGQDRWSPLVAWCDRWGVRIMLAAWLAGYFSLRRYFYGEFL